MDQNELLTEIRYVRSRVDALHNRMNDLYASTLEQHKVYDAEIVRLQEHAASIKSMTGRISGFISAAVSAIVAALVSMFVKRLAE